MPSSHFVLFLLLSIVMEVHPLPGGAPAAACADVLPLGHIAQGHSSMDVTTILYLLDLSVFDSDGGQSYEPGMTYIITLSGTSGEMFRGLLVQARLAADGTTPVGSFQVTDSANTELSACTPPQSAVTHPNSNLKTSVPLTWTAPPEGTGEIIFRYAVVEQFETFWAPAVTGIIQEAAQPPDPPMFTQTVFQASVNETFDPTHPRPSDGFVTIACIDPVSGDPAVGIAYSIPATLGIIPFAVDSTSGALSVTEDLDFETDPNTYSFPVLCNYAEFPNSSAMGTVEITVLPVNEFRPTVVGLSIFTENINEDAPTGTIIAATSGAGLISYEVTDNDAGLDDSTITFTFTTENSITNLFSLNFTTGYLVLGQELDLDSGAISTFLTLEITACDLIPAVDDCPTIQVRLIVNAVNEFSPEFSQDSYSASILESAPENSEVVVVQCADEDVGVGVFEGINIASTDQTILDIFSVDSTTGNITLSRPVDFETDPQSFVFMVECNDVDGLQSLATVSVTIEGVNEFTPEFSQFTYAIDILESSPAGVVLEVAQCIDGDTGAGAFAGVQIVSTDQETLDTFAVDSSSGNISLERELDFESIVRYEFMVRCFDNEGLETLSVVTVSVGDVFEAIQFSQVVYEASVNETFLPTNPRPLDGFITVTCVNPNTSTPLTNSTYNITTSTPLPFNINSETGELVVTEDLDFESGTTSYSFSVLCSLVIEDGSNVTTVTDTATVDITILPVNEFRPEINASSVIAQPVLETLMVGTVIASTTNSSLIEYAYEDADTGVADRNVTFTFAEEDKNTSFFSLDLLTGNLSLESELDFDNQTEDIFIVRIPVTLCDIFPPVDTCPNLEIRLLVESVNEFDPQFSQDIYEASIPESIEVNSEVVVAECIDLDRGTGALASIDIISTDQNVTDTFNIDSSTGNITLRQEVDFETIQSYEFTVQCRDVGFNDTAVVRITIEDVNDNNPEPQPIDDIMLNDQTPIGTVVTTAVCTDRDTVDSTITYALNNSLGLFEIATSSGEINTTGALILNSTTFIQDYELTVLCTDSGTALRTGTTLINIQVYKDDATPPSFTNPTLTADVFENTIVGVDVITVQANDIDSPELLYSLANESNPGLFAINSSTGAITITQTPDRESADAYQATIVATEVRVAPGIPQSATAQLTINILDVNDNAPFCDITASQLTATITAGNHDSTSLSVTFSCTDADDGDSGVIRYSLIESTLPALERGNFVINEVTGLLTLEGAIRVGTYSFSVRVSDSGLPALSTTLEVDLTVSPAPFSQDIYETTIPETLEVNSEVVVAECMGAGVMASIEIISTDQNVTDTFNIDNSTGNITLRQEVDFETIRSYEFTVQCRDVGFNDTAVVRITIEDVNDNNPEPQPINDIMLNDQTQIGTVVTTAVCTDRDTIDSTITYTLNNSLGLFEIATSSGEINTTGALILNSTVFIQDYELTVLCTDSGTAPRTGTTLINIQVYKDDATPPSFTNPTVTTDVFENAIVGVDVITVQANDIDSPELQYSFANESIPGLFAINSSTGAITITQTPDRESADAYQATIVATEVRVAPGIPQSATAQLTINILDVNDNAPFCDITASQLTANLTAGNHDSTSLSVTFSCTDADDGDSGVIRYSLIESTLPALERGNFVINEVTGLLTLEGAIRAGTYSFSVRVSDSGLPALSTTLEVDLTVSPAPFSQDIYETTIPETLEVNSEVVVVECMGAGVMASIEIISTNQNVTDTFNIDNSTGNITLRQEVDFETIRSYEFTVQCRDVGFNDTAVVRITIEDGNDNNPEPQPIDDIMLNDQTPIGTVVTTAVCTDRDTVDSTITYTLNNSLGLFEIATSSGEINTTGALILNSTTFIQDYELAVLCSDSGTAPRTGTTLINIQVYKDDATPPSFSTPTLTADVFENAPVGERVTAVQANDTDSPELLYSLANESIPGLFAINSSTGAITTAQTPDRESADAYQATIVATEVRVAPGIPQSGTTQLTINILDVNDNAPFCNITASQLTANLTAGNHDSTSLSVTFSCNDADDGDNRVLRYSLIESTLPALERGNFVINEVTGLLTLEGAIRAGTYSFSVLVSDSGLPALSTTLEVDLTVSPAPFSQDIYETTIPETLEVNSEVVVVECMGAGVMASIDIISTNQNVTDTFNIDNSTGNITLRQEVDFETIRSYEFTVQCRDVGFNDTAVVRITIEDVNDNNPVPQPINDIMLNDQTPIGTVVTTAVCTDRDTVDSTITYTLNNSLGLFEIATSSGEINTTGALILNSTTFIQDYELTVLCTDSGTAPRTGTTLINIQVYKDDATPPSFTNPTVTTDVFENAIVGVDVITVQANDIDSPELQYSLANESNPGLFAINSSTGAITTAQTPDRESADVYQATIVATEVRVAPGIPQSATAQLTINILDVNDNAPFCDTTASQLTATITAGNHDSTSLSVTFSCNDADDGDNGVIRYSLIESTLPALERGNFVINEVTGLLTLEGAIRAGTYSFSVLVSDSGLPALSTTLEVDLTVSPAPFSQDIYETTIPETLEVNSEVVVVECMGAGVKASIDIISTNQNVTDTFNIDNSTGNITLRQEVDFETIRSYEFIVQCRDVGFNDTAVVRITIEDVNDNNPEPQPIDDIMLNDQTPIGTVVTTAVCTDRDTVDSTITYTLNNSLGLFEIATSSGEINTTGALILNSTTFIQDYELTVLCTDSGTAPRTGTTLINIQVYKDDATPPSFTNPTVTTDVFENAIVGVDVITVQANDIDSPELQYSLANENIPGLFAINSSTGAITTAQTPDRESADAYQATIVATEVRVAPGVPQSATAQLTINILDVNDNAPTCITTASQLTANLTAGNHDSTSLSVTFSCNDADDGDNRVLRYSLIESTLPALERGNFVINEVTGLLTLEGAIRAGTYSFSVRVSDSGLPALSITLEVSLTVSPAPDDTPAYVIVVPIVVIVFGLLFIIILVIVIIALFRRRRERKATSLIISDIVAKPEDTSMVFVHHNLLAAEGGEIAVTIEMVEKASLQGVEAVMKEPDEIDECGTDTHPKKDASASASPEGEKTAQEEPMEEKGEPVEKEGGKEAQAPTSNSGHLNDTHQPLEKLKEAGEVKTEL